MLPGPSTAREIHMRADRLVLAAYGVFAVANIVASGLSDHTLDLVTKPLLMPLLALWLWLASRRAGLRPTAGMIAGLLFSAAGDIALIGDGSGWFLAGMVLFLIAHLCYITTLVRHGAVARLRRFPQLLIPIGYAIVLVAALAWLWDGLSAIGLAVPMTGYALALAGTAVTCAAFGWRMGLGGGLFLLSDLLIAVDVADAGALPGPPIWVMVTYLAAQTLIATGWLAHQRRTAADQTATLAVPAPDAA
jgi:uncharacterized membrane protein YhhN